MVPRRFQNCFEARSVMLVWTIWFSKSCTWVTVLPVAGSTQVTR